MNKPKCGLLIGCNYTNTSTNLYNCTTDVLQMSGVLIDAYQYQTILLRDDNPSYLPTKENILKSLTYLIDNSYKYSEIWFHYSGHGSEKLKNQNISNPLIVPCDYISAGCISNEDIYNIIKDVKCPFRLIFDSLQLSNDPININNINQLVVVLYRTTPDRITENLISLLRNNNYVVKYNDILSTIPNTTFVSTQQLNYNNNYINYLYYNYQLLYDTVVNMNKMPNIIEPTPEQIIQEQNKLNIKKRIIQSKHK
jgi:hypothetical protein